VSKVTISDCTYTVVLCVPFMYDGLAKCSYRTIRSCSEEVGDDANILG